MTASDPVALAVDAQHLQLVARHIQAQVDSRIRAVEQASSGLRQIQIATRNPATRTCTVYLDGDTTSEHYCRPASTSVVPVAGAQGWAIQNGTDLVLIGMRDTALPKVHCVSHNTSGSVTTEEDWVFASGTVMTDTDGMFNPGNGNFIVRWPGWYDFGARTFANSSGDGVQPKIRVQALGDVLYYDGDQTTIHGTNDVFLRAVSGRYFNEGEGIQLRVASVGGSSVFGLAGTDELGTVMWMSYKP